MKQKTKYYLICGTIFFCGFMMVTLLLAIIEKGDLNRVRAYERGAILDLVLCVLIWLGYKAWQSIQNRNNPQKIIKK